MLEMTADHMLDWYLQQHALQQQQNGSPRDAPLVASPLVSSETQALAPVSSDLAPLATQALTQSFAPMSPALALPPPAPQTLAQAFAQQAVPMVTSPVTSLILSHFGPPMPRNPLLPPFPWTRQL